MLEAGIVSLLAASPVASLVGSRIYPVVLPPETTVFPALTYQAVSSSSEWATDRTEYDEKRIQFDAWAQSYADCKAVLKALNGVLHGFVGTLSDGTRVILALRDVTVDFWQSEPRLYRSTADF